MVAFPDASSLGEGDSILSISGLQKNYQGLRAVQGLDLDVPPKEITGIIGPNGAGKTSVFSIVAGDVKADAGQVLYQGVDILGLTPDRVCATGIARTYQNPRLFARLTCVENVLAARHGRTNATLLEYVLSLPRARRERARDLEIARGLLAQVGLRDSAHLRPSQLSYGNMRRLEVARALATEPKLLLMDEPTAGLAVHVIESLLETLRSLASGGLSILLIEHNMSVVSAICSKVVAMDHGSKIAEGSPDEVLRTPAVIDAYLGA